MAGGKKPKALPFPSLEGEESVTDFLAKYKRQCIARKSLLREVLEKVEAEKPQTGKSLAFNSFFYEQISSALSDKGQ